MEMFPNIWTSDIYIPKMTITISNTKLGARRKTRKSTKHNKG